MDMQRIIERTADGSETLYVPGLEEHYHSVKGALTESRHIFIDMGLLPATDSPTLSVFEVGFGTGLNALLTWQEAERRGLHVHYTTLELYPLTADEASRLDYHPKELLEALHRAPWGEETRLSPRFTLLKLCEDFTRLPGRKAFPRPFDVVYFDAFSPEKQPGMWNEELFVELWRRMSPGGTLTTYCAKGEVRRRLQRAGFTVERLPGPPGGKREMLRARRPPQSLGTMEVSG